MIGGGFLGGGISIVPAGKALIYASMTTEDGANIPNAVFKATRTGSTVTVNGSIDGRAELLVDAGHTYTVSVTPAGGSYLNRSQTVVTASAKSYAVKFYLYPSKANEASTTASLNALNASISTHTGKKDNPHAVTKAQVGLSNVDNTSDANKPISTATQTALDGKVGKTGNEDIAGLKTFKNDINVEGNSIRLRPIETNRYISFSSYAPNDDLGRCELAVILRRIIDGTPTSTYVGTFRAIGEEVYLTNIRMRSSPGILDAVNYRRLLDTYDEIVGYVDDQDALKADKTTVNSELALKADKTALDAKADTTAVNSGLALKQDKFKLYQHNVRMYATASKTFSVELSIINTSSTPINSVDALMSYLEADDNQYHPCSGMFWSTNKTTSAVATGIRSYNLIVFTLRGMNMSDGNSTYLRNVDRRTEEVIVTGTVREIL